MNHPYSRKTTRYTKVTQPSSGEILQRCGPGLMTKGHGGWPTGSLDARGWIIVLVDRSQLPTQTRKGLIHTCLRGSGLLSHSLAALSILTGLLLGLLARAANPVLCTHQNCGSRGGMAVVWTFTFCRKIHQAVWPGNNNCDIPTRPSVWLAVTSRSYCGLVTAKPSNMKRHTIYNAKCTRDRLYKQVDPELFLG